MTLFLTWIYIEDAIFVDNRMNLIAYTACVFKPVIRIQQKIG